MEARKGIVYILVVALLFIGAAILLQPLHGDSWRYNQNFLILRDLSFGEMNALVHPEYAYRLINWLVGQFTASHEVLFFVLFAIFIYVFYKALKNIYPTFDRYYIFMAYLLYPFFIAYLVSGKRQGLSLVFMLLAISFLWKNQNLKGAVALVIATLFHKAMLLAILPILLFAWLKEKNILKIASIIYVVSLIVSIVGMNAIIPSETLVDYLQLGSRYKGYFIETEEIAAINYQTGFRLDFTLFSLIPVFLYLYFKKRIEKKDKKWVYGWLGLYLLLNSIFQFFSFVPYSDRFAAFSWFLLPLVSYVILESVNKKYAVLFTVLLLLASVVLLQVVTFAYFPTPEIF